MYSPKTVNVPASIGDDVVLSEKMALHCHQPAWEELTDTINSCKFVVRAVPVLKTVPFNNHSR